MRQKSPGYELETLKLGVAMKQFNDRKYLLGALLWAFIGFIPLLSTAGINATGGAGRIFNVRDYGAAGRKEDDARPAIQRAIGACSAAGGGTITFPPGQYTSGTLHLCSHIHVELAEGATLYATTDPAAYDCGAIVSKAALFYGEDLEDVSLAGRGIVDGQAEYEWRPDDFEKNFEHKKIMQGLGKPLMRSLPKDFPKRQIFPHLVWLGRCRYVRISGLSFLHSPNWTFALYACRDAALDGVYIYTSLKEGVWADGIDLDGCRDVSISNCAIETGDDCVALVSENSWGPPLPCENICVTNCRLSSASAGVKFTEGNIAGMRNVKVVNTLFNNVNRGVVLLTSLGGSVSNVLLSDLTIDCSRFDWFWAGDGQPFRCANFRRSELEPDFPRTNDVPAGSIRGLTLRNIVAHAKGSCLFYGHADRRLEDIRLENVKLFISADPTAPFDKAVHGLDFRRVANLKLKDVEVVAEAPSLPAWESALNFDDVQGLEIDGLFAGPLLPEGPAPVIALREISGATIRHVRAVEGTDILFDIAGPGSRDIRFESNDFSAAKRACRLGDDVAPNTVVGLRPAPAAGAR